MREPPEADFLSAVARTVVKSPTAVLAVLGLLFMPFFAISVAGSSYSSEPMDLLPAAAPAGVTLRSLEAEFGTGRVWPFFLLIEAKPGQSEPLLSPHFFSSAHDVLERLIASVPGTPRENITGALFANGQPVPFDLVSMAFESSSPLANSTTGRHLRALADTFFTPDRRATYLYITLGGDPFGDSARTWLHAARTYLSEVSHAGGHTWRLAGMAPLTIDIQDSVMSAFPIAIAATALTVFALLGFAFGSFLVPLRSVLTTASTLAFVYATLQIVHVSCLLPPHHVS